MRKALLAAAPFVVTTVTWAVTSPVPTIGWAMRLAQLFGTLALTGFAASLLLSTQARILVDASGGTRGLSVMHRGVAIAATAFMCAHVVGLLLSSDNLNSTWTSLGAPTFTLFAVLIVCALLAGKIKPNVWKFVHRFTALAFVIGLAHYYGSSSFGAFGLRPLSLWMDVVAAQAIAAAVYSVFLRQARTNS